MKRIPLLVIFPLMLLTWSCSYSDIKTASSGSVSSYPSALQQLIIERCTNCRGAGNQNGSISYIENAQAMIRGGFVTTGNAAGSTLYTKLTADPPYGARMPKGGPFFSETELLLVKNWIDNLPTTGTGTSQTISFRNDIAPLLENALGSNSNACIVCHDASSPSAGYALTEDDSTASYSAITAQNITVGDPDNSTLYIKLSQSSPSVGGKQMPRNGPTYMTDAELLKVYTWIEEGANDN